MIHNIGLLVVEKKIYQRTLAAANTFPCHTGPDTHWCSMLADAQLTRFPWAIPAGLVLINLLAKGAFLNINLGEYTDGILQLTAWETKAGLYPPLYEALSHGVAVLGVSLEQGARIVSLIAASLCVIPVWHLARRLGSGNAALFAGILYTASPMPWRWSVRVMTDALYLLLSTGALVYLMEAWATQRIALGSGADAAGDAAMQGSVGTPARDPNSSALQARAGKMLAAATLCAGLAGLTRYQGALLAPLLAFVFLRYWLTFRRIPWVSAVVAIAFAAVAVWWVSINNSVHAGQFTSRTGPTAFATVMAWINTAESFVLISPYYLGYPIFAAALVGVAVVRRTATPWFARPAAVLWGVYAIMLLALQAAFGSFQYRYLLPILPMAVALAGVGFARAETWWQRCPATKGEAAQTNQASDSAAGRRCHFAVFALSLLYLVGFSLAILVLQRETYGDQRAAADYIRNNVPPTAPVFSNERYGSYTQFGSVKLSRWSGRPVQIVSPDKPMPAGSVLVLGTAYGGNEAVGAQMAALSQQYDLRPLTPVPFTSQIVPLMDDIMTDPMFNQNPLAWVLRYVPQNFATQIFQVQPRATGGGAGNGA